MQRQINVLGPIGIHTKELRRRHTGNREESIVNEDRLARRLAGLAEASLGVAETEYGYWRCSNPIVVVVDQPAGSRWNTQSAKEGTRDVLALGQVRLSLDLHIQPPRAIKRKHRREVVVVVAEQFEGCVREIPAGIASLRVLILAATNMTVDRRVRLAVPFHDHYRLVIFHRH